MIEECFHNIAIPGTHEEAGFRYGGLCAPLLESGRLNSFLVQMMRLNRTEPMGLARNAARWACTLPDQYRVQMDAFALGAGVELTLVEQFLYADIAAATLPDVTHGNGKGAGLGISATLPDQLRVIAADVCEMPMAAAAQIEAGPQSPARFIGDNGPMCSGLMIDHGGQPWIARNCDWYLATLCRGTAAVHHRVPGRIPCTAVGLMGDIDADTGMNAAGLWLHMHTLLAHDEPRAGTSCISWLFWMREALETCESVGDVERFIAGTSRDRGVLLFAAHGDSGERAIFECTRSAYTRVDPWDVQGRSVLLATNHCKHKHPAGDCVPQRNSTFNGTIGRYRRLVELVGDAFPEDCPDDLAEIMADDRIEMREGRGSEHLRTIYSAVAAPRDRTCWFASGACPAASRGTWRKIVQGRT